MLTNVLFFATFVVVCIDALSLCFSLPSRMFFLLQSILPRDAPLDPLTATVQRFLRLRSSAYADLPGLSTRLQI